jgi:hypothetical protein
MICRSRAPDIEQKERERKKPSKKKNGRNVGNRRKHGRN